MKKSTIVIIAVIFFSIAIIYIWRTKIMMPNVVMEEGTPTMENPLNLDMQINKAIYNKGEAITTTLRLENISSQDVAIKKRFALNNIFAPKDFLDIAFIVTDQEGNREDFLERVNIGAPKENDFGTLKPGESIEREYDISNSYDFQKSGRYTVEARYYNQSSIDGITPWKGEVSSNIVTLMIEDK
jgi:hypothetical protein